MARRPARRSDRAAGAAGGFGEVRIIGGEHRGRKLRFPDLPGLRPTGDRIKETLFNWLQASLPGAACLDLFAGSGALGLEAASRGAGSVVMVERAVEAVAQLRANVEMLGLRSVSVEQGSALDWLARPASKRFDLVFLDPPFGEDLLGEACRLLARQGWLNPGACVYVETDAGKPSPQLPVDWSLLKEKRAGQVRYRLFRTPSAGK